MTNGSDRLDRIENDLETVKDILLTVARRAEATDGRQIAVSPKARLHPTVARPARCES